MKLNKLSPSKFKFGMNLYPAFVFGRIRIKEVSKDFQKIKVIIKKSLLNINGSGTMFGGTLFAAADPFYALMYWQIFGNRFNKNVQVWTKSASIQFKKPVVGKVFLEFNISDLDIEEAKLAVEQEGRFNKKHIVEIKNTEGELCAFVELVTYIGVEKN